MFYFGRERGQLRGDERLPDSSVTDSTDDSSRIMTVTTTTASDLVPETESVSSSDLSSTSFSEAAAAASSSASAVPAGTVPVQTAQPGNDDYVPEVYDENNGEEDSSQQEEQWVDIEFGSYANSGIYMGIKKYYYNDETKNTTIINSIKREPSSGTVVINYTTTKEDDSSNDLVAFIIDDKETGATHGSVYISPKSVVHDGYNYTATYQNDVIKDDAYTYQWVVMVGTDFDYVDTNGAYNRSTFNKEYYEQLLIVDDSGTAHISKDACELSYNSSNNYGDTVYTWLMFLDDDTLTIDTDRYLNEILEDIEKYGTGKGQNSYFLDNDIPEIKNITVDNDSKYFEIYDGILYFKINDYRWLLWTTERTPKRLKLPDNVIIYNEKELEKIHMSDYNDIDFGNNTWLKNDDYFLGFLDVTIPEDW